MSPNSSSWGYSYSNVSLFIFYKFSKRLNSYSCLSGLELDAAVEKESKKSKKRQATSDPDLPTTTDKLDFGKNYTNILNC